MAKLLIPPRQFPAVATRMADFIPVPLAIKTDNTASELNGTTVAARKLARNNPQRLYSRSPSANQDSFYSDANITKTYSSGKEDAEK